MSTERFYIGLAWAALQVFASYIAADELGGAWAAIYGAAWAIMLTYGIARSVWAPKCRECKQALP